MEFKAKDIAEALGGIVCGDENISVNNVGELETAQTGQLSFLSNMKYEKFLYTTKASVVIVNDSFTPKTPPPTTLIKVKDSYAAVASLLEMYEQAKPQKSGIESPSFIDQTSSIGEHIYLGAFAYIGKHSTIGNNTKIYPHTYIGDNVTIGENCKIYSGVKIYSHTKIKDNCIIHAGAVIGSDGFGFAPEQDGTYKKIPQVGNVVIEENVEIGANSCVDRAMLGATIVKAGAKIDNLVQIAHNCEIGENTVIAAQTGIAGSTSIGKNCVFGGQVGVAGHIKVADKVQAQAQSGITSGTKTGDIVMGTPAINHKNYYKSYAIFRQQPQLQKDFKKIKEVVTENIIKKK